jgi:hypothetical protein
MKVTRQTVLCLLLAANTAKALRLLSVNHREVDNEWADTLAASTNTDEAEMREQTL